MDLMKDYERMLEERIAYFESNMEMDKKESFISAQCYRSALNMFRSAKNGDYEGLSQYDYFRFRVKS